MCAQYNRKDRYYNLAKDSGYRSRAAFKLIELDKKHSLIKKGMKIADLGCWPGSWLQVISDKIGASGLAVGIDLVEIEDLAINNVKFVCGDVEDEKLIEQISSLAGGKFDLVLSDMSPKLTGISEADGAQTARCAYLAVNCAKKILKPGGNLVIKLFKSQSAEEFIKDIKSNFTKFQRCGLDATRSTSNEFYFVGFGLKVL